MPPKKDDKAKKEQPPKDDKKGNECVMEGKGGKGKQQPKKQDPKDKGKKNQKNKSPEKNEKNKGDDKGKKDVKADKKQKDPKSPKGKKDGKNPINKSAEKLPQPRKVKNEEDVIKDSGLLEAYELFLRSLCKHGLPTGDIYEFAAQQMQKFEKRKRAKELKMRAELEIRKAARKNDQRLKSEEA